MDPQGCQDIDDSMHVHWIRPGVVELGVHIADVCAFVEQGSSLDIEAQRRGTTVYLSHCRIDMLPSLISSDIASLHQNKERLTMTVVWELQVRNPNGSFATESDFSQPLSASSSSEWYDKFIIDFPENPTWFGRSVIESNAAMTYEQADQLIRAGSISEQPSNVPDGQAGKPVPQCLCSRVTPDLRVLTLISRGLRKRREGAGSVNLSTGDDVGSELRFVPTGNNWEAVEVAMPRHLEVHETVAELMIVSNSTVARIISEALPLQALVRVHAPPPIVKVENLRDFCDQIGLELFQSADPVEVSKQIPKLQTLLLSKGQAQDLQNTLNILTNTLMRVMSEAAYVSTGSLSGDMKFEDSQKNAIASEELLSKDNLERRRGHYGLGVLHYTHFTSPIRRYADIIVHRQLLYVLSLQDTVSAVHKVTHNEICAINHDQIPEENEQSEEEGVDDFIDSLLGDIGDDLLLTEPAPASIKHDDIEKALQCKASKTENESAVLTPPYSSSELFKIVNELNILNRNSKLAQAACQKLFLTLYLTNRIHECEAVVYGVKENGLTVYLPCFDIKCSIYVKNRDGMVCLHPNLLSSFKEITKGKPIKQSNRTAPAGELLVYPDIFCRLMKTEDKKQKETSALKFYVSDEHGKMNSFLFGLSPLQSVQVLATAKTSAAGRTEIDLTLFGLTASKSKKRAWRSASENSAAISLKPEGHGLSHKESSEDAFPPKNTSSYAYLTMCVKAISNMHNKSTVQRRQNQCHTDNDEVLLHTLSGSKKHHENPYKHYRIKGTGRLCFDDADVTGHEIFFASEMFRSHSRSASGSSSAKGSGFLVGREAAMQKMKNWGEEWAEEEDLPGGLAEVEDTEISDDNLGPIAFQIGGGSGRTIGMPPSASTNYGKTASLASKRLYKLKAAKKNSKYN